MQVTATKSMHIIIQELMNFLHANKFSPWELLTLSVLMSSVLSNYVSTCMYISTGAGRSTCSGTMKRFCSREVYNCFINPLLLMFTSPNSIL